MRIGYDPVANRIVFPHFWGGKLVGWQKRSIPESTLPGFSWPPTEFQKPKYKNSSGFPKSEHLYMYDAALGEHTVIVVESPMSVAKAYELYIGGVVATFGAKVSQAQIDLLKYWGRVIVWFDADRAGQAGAGKLVQGLYRHAQVSVVEPEPGKDLGDYHTADQIKSKLKGCRPAALWLPEYWRNGGQYRGSDGRQSSSSAGPQQGS
jgi:DNA primase